VSIENLFRAARGYGAIADRLLDPAQPAAAGDAG